MDVYKLLILQFIAHFLSDFLFQSQKCFDEKETDGFKSKYLYKHTAVTFIFSAFLSFQFTFILFSLIISGLHFLLDGIKKYVLNKEIVKKYLFFIDQIFHLSVILFVVMLYDKFYDCSFIIEIPELKYLFYILAYILILKPTNILIREIFKFFEIKLDNLDTEKDELPNAGKLIGITERILTLTLIILGQYAAIGFIMAAKSILRFKETQTQKAEYVLIGTMLSFGIAIITGIFVENLITKL
ncbi:MAG: DUF3307 domain-containing protein [Bacteroidetes bacterium]|nr:MAG: DUF3307 domain-containing protein [Bacteroidota bacterium]